MNANRARIIMNPPTVMNPVTPTQKSININLYPKKNCGYYGSNELAPDVVRYRGFLVETGEVWSI